jgi:hypothetical protein
MRRLLLLVFLFVQVTCFSQDIHQVINLNEVTRIEQVLASDEMGGRKPFTPSIDKAADFISAEFSKNSLAYFPGLKTYKQTFQVIKAKFTSAAGTLDNTVITPENIIAVTTTASLQFDQNQGYEVISLDSSADLMKEASRIQATKKKSLVLVSMAHAKNFSRLKRFKRDSFEPKEPVVFVLTDSKPSSWKFDIQHQVSQMELSNVVGVLPGRSRKDEFVVFSAHYDHLGIGKQNAAGDSIYNGANDDAAGTTAVMMLANYFSKLKNNERTLVFVAFTAEELGGFGSQYFSRQIDPAKVTAMFNIEMIGTLSQWGKNSAYITGHDKSDFIKILSANLAGTSFKFEPDPYPKQNLFYRSDNATLAALGVPAHTISTSQMDSDKTYHTQDDEIETLDLANMTEIIKAIAISSKTIIEGKDTPSRVEKLAR